MSNSGLNAAKAKKSLVGIDANGNAVSYYERVIIRNKNPKPRRNI